jgi:membrane dipeptidase
MFNYRGIIMGRNKKYLGYKAFQYLEPGVDYQQFKLAKEINRVEPYIIPLSKNEEERVEEIIEKSILISLHDHPTIMPEDPDQTFELERAGREFTGYEGLSVSGLDAVFDFMMDGSEMITSKMGWKWTDVIHDLGMRLSDLAHQDFVIHCKKVEDIIEAHKTGRLAMVFGVESSTPIENEVDRVDVLYGLGVRCMGITYGESNMLGSGRDELRDGGLTDFGYDVVKRMNKLGVLIDVSHSGDQTALDAMDASNKPVVITHAGAKALNDTRRLFPDDLLKALAEREGVIGIAACPNITLTKMHKEHNIESVMEHVEYCVNLMGVDHVGIGPDTVYGDHVGFYRTWAKRSVTAGVGHYERGKRAPAPSRDFERMTDYVKGFENPSEFPNVVRWLVKHGYSDSEIAKIIGGNALRLLETVWC